MELSISSYLQRYCLFAATIIYSTVMLTLKCTSELSFAVISLIILEKPTTSPNALYRVDTQ